MIIKAPPSTMMMIVFTSTATVHAIAPSFPRRAVPAPRAKPARCQKGRRMVGRALWWGIKELKVARWTFSWSHMCWMVSPTGVLPNTACCPA